jgi:hypothetical protein
LCFACLISFFFFNFIHLAAAQGVSLTPSKRVVTNLHETILQTIEDRHDATNAQAPSFNEGGWQQAGIPYSADQLDAVINGQSSGGARFLSSTVNLVSQALHLDPQYTGNKVEVVSEEAHTGAQVFDALVRLNLTMRQTAVNPSCQELQSSSRWSSA